MQKTLFGGSIQSNRSFLPKYQSRVCRLGVNEILALCMHIAFAEWVAQLQQVTGSSAEGEHKAHRHSCIATSALLLCTGNHDLYVLVVLFSVIFVEISA